MVPSKRWMAVTTAVLGTALSGLMPPAASAAPSPSGSPDGRGAWSSVSGKLPGTFSGKRVALPSAYQAFTLKPADLSAALAGAPAETGKAAMSTLPEISVPGPDGVLHTFRVRSSPVMEPGLAAKVPAFHSYVGFGVDDTTASGRFDISPLGFHGSVTTATGSWYVDPAYQGDRTRHVAYRSAARPAPTAARKRVDDQVGKVARAARAADSPAPGSVVQQRVYRLALANDPGYAVEVGAANVDLAKAAAVNRVNQIYNDDMAIKFVLIAGNQQLDFNTQAQYTGANGPCGAQACFTPVPADPANNVVADDLTKCTAVKIDQNTLAVTKIVGVDNYDVGHILDNGGNGGVARFGAGQDVNKGAGCSGAGEGTKSNSDLLAVEFFAHEIGHQFGAAHVYSAPSCGGISATTDVETGSGSSIMGYAGTCAPADNIQGPSDPYFSQISLKQMQAYITSTIDPADNGGQPAENGGSTIITTTNTSPVVTVPATPAIPVRTPFTLSGTVTDAGQTPVNIWEQNDPGTARPLMDNTKTDGALFRVFSQAAVAPDYGNVYNAPGLSQATAAGSTRTFPDLAQIAAGNTNAAGGTCPTPAAGVDPTDDQIECFAEFLPTSARTLHFDLTARDRFPSGGGVTIAESVVTVAGTTPFAVTNTAGTVAAGSTYAVKWNVASTTAAPFSVANVKISYSTDGGLTFPTVLAASTPNNGTANVTVPATATTLGRFKVEAIGQPFFDTSHANLTVTVVATTAPLITASTPPNTGTIGTPYSYTFVAGGSPAPGFSVASGTLPAGLTLNPTTGVLSGTPTTAAASTFTVQATNSAGNAVTPSRTITVSAATTVPVFVASTPPTTGVVGTAYTFTFTATGSPAPVFSVGSGTLPAG
jgi:hypothetical protein